MDVVDPRIEQHTERFVFIDADKPGYVDYYEATLPRLSERGVIVADNTLAGGRVEAPAARRSRTSTSTSPPIPAPCRRFSRSGTE